MLRRTLLALAGCVALAPAAEAATLVIRAQGIRSAEGRVYAGVCARSFNEADCPYKDRATARAGTVEMRISNVRPGRYAIAVYHDVNGNGTLDRVVGIPREPYGFSNGVGRGGIPSFEGALIEVSEPTTVITVTVQ
jgi:uncharacterized protein (DUF2141 family)